MTIVNKKEPFILFWGDILFFMLALWVTLVARYWSLPDLLTWRNHLAAFSILFLVWVFSFYVAGLYKKHTLVLKSSLPNILFHTQIINIVLAVVFFYFIPYFSIAPKTNLFIYLIISSGLIYLWRIYIFDLITPVKKQNAILISSKENMEELAHEINNNKRYGFVFSDVIDLESVDEYSLKQKITEIIEKKDISVIVADINNKKAEPFLPGLYDLIFEKVEFIDTYELYEYIFDRVPISMMNYSWFIQNISSKNKIAYDFLKRTMDISISLVIFIPSLILYPFVMLAVYLESRVNPFIVQKRIGKDNHKIYLYKFRSMTSNDNGKWVTENDDRVTKVGKIIRATRIDEIPQLFNVLKGDISLIGPRPDIVGNFDNLKDQLPYYTIRNVVKPGLSGWAQTHQEIPPQSLEETRTRLAYDLFYIKNRSFVLDLKIALQTLKTLISRTGR